MLHGGVLHLVLLAPGPGAVAAHVEGLGPEGRRPGPEVGAEAGAEAPETGEGVVRLHVVPIVEK